MDNDIFEVTKEKSEDLVKFLIKGRVNATNSEKLHDILKKTLVEGEKHIILNMLWVEFLSSAGIRVILKTYQEINDLGGSFGIEMPSINVRNVLGMTALDDILIK